MKLEEILKKQDQIKLKAIKLYIEIHKNAFGNVNAKKLLDYIERLYSKNENK